MYWVVATRHASFWHLMSCEWSDFVKKAQERVQNKLAFRLLNRNIL